MSPLERLEWMTKLARSGATFGMMAVASDIAYRAGDDGAYGLPDGGMKEAGARRARATLLRFGWLVRTNKAWFPAFGVAIKTDTVVSKRYDGIATVVSPTDTTVAVSDTVVSPTDTAVANTDTMVSHNRVDSNGTVNWSSRNPLGVDTPDPPPKPKHMLRFEAQYQTPTQEVVAIPFDETPQGKACAENRARIRAMRLAKESQSV